MRTVLFFIFAAVANAADVTVWNNSGRDGVEIRISPDPVWYPVDSGDSATVEVDAQTVAISLSWERPDETVDERYYPGLAPGVYNVSADFSIAPMQSFRVGGSPEWFDFREFFTGWAFAFSTVGTWFVFWLAKRSANDALD